MYRRWFFILFLALSLWLLGYATGQVYPWLYLYPVVGGLLGTGLALLDGVAQDAPFERVLGGSIGGVAGLLVVLFALGFFVHFLDSVPNLPAFVFGILLLSATGIYFGVHQGVIAAKKMDRARDQEQNTPCSPKVLDTSVIIDGRVADIIEIGFLEGRFIVPRFVIKELQNMADSGNKLKRNRGRRGLDILNRVRQELPVQVDIVEEDFPDIPEVDAKLIALAESLDANILTNDFNLNKVAQLQDLQVLNINDLSNAVKPVYIPGETFEIEVIKEGEEKQQGVGYLDDGTMVVIENGREYVGETVPVTVTSVIQTSAGRMIFTERGQPSESAR